MEKKKIVWLSRHNLNEDQQADLFRLYGKSDIVMKNITWSATADAEADRENNSQQWDDILAENPVIIAGVFPPVALECVSHDTPLISAISKQDRKTREDGSVQIEFIHLRWSKDLNPNNK